MPPISHRPVLSLVVVVTAFVGGMVFDAVGHPEARAQSLTTSTIVVPEGGLYFRTPDGTPVARLSHGARGASFELYDNALATPGAAAKDLRSKPDVVEDPFSKGARPGERPGAGF